MSEQGSNEERSTPIPNRRPKGERACDSCKTSKKKCEVAESETTDRMRCKNCIKKNRQCTFTVRPGRGERPIPQNPPTSAPAGSMYEGLPVAQGGPVYIRPYPIEPINVTSGQRQQMMPSSDARHIFPPDGAYYPPVEGDFTNWVPGYDPAIGTYALQEGDPEARYELYAYQNVVNNSN